MIKSHQIFNQERRTPMETDQTSVEQPAVTEATKELSTIETEQLTTTDEKNLSQLETEIKEHLTKIAINYIEVGKRLLKAKSLVKHGDWQNWLEQNFQLGQSSANKLMSVAKRFAQSELVTILNSTQMIAMLDLPKGQEEEFIKQKNTNGTPVADMTVRTLREEIKQWNSTHENPKKKKRNTSQSAIKAETTGSSNSSQDTKPQPDDAKIQNEEISTASINPTEITTPEENAKKTETQNETDDNNYLLLEQFLRLSNDLANISDLNKLAQKYAENYPDKFANEINNLSFTLSLIQSLQINQNNIFSNFPIYGGQLYRKIKISS